MSNDRQLVDLLVDNGPMRDPRPDADRLVASLIADGPAVHEIDCPARMEPIAGWWLCPRCKYSALAEPGRPAPRCPGKVRGRVVWEPLT